MSSGPACRMLSDGDAPSIQRPTTRFAVCLRAAFWRREAGPAGWGGPRAAGGCLPVCCPGLGMAAGCSCPPPLAWVGGNVNFPFTPLGVCHCGVRGAEQGPPHGTGAHRESPLRGVRPGPAEPAAVPGPLHPHLAGVGQADGGPRLAIAGRSNRAASARCHVSSMLPLSTLSPAPKPVGPNRMGPQSTLTSHPSTTTQPVLQRPSLCPPQQASRSRSVGALGFPKVCYYKERKKRAEGISGDEKCFRNTGDHLTGHLRSGVCQADKGEQTY